MYLVSYDSVLNHFNLANILSAKGPKRAAYSARRRILYTFCPDLSYVGTGKPTKTLRVTVHASMMSLKVSLINFIS